MNYICVIRIKSATWSTSGFASMELPFVSLGAMALVISATFLVFVVHFSYPHAGGHSYGCRSKRTSIHLSHFRLSFSKETGYQNDQQAYFRTRNCLGFRLVFHPVFCEKMTLDHLIPQVTPISATGRYWILLSRLLNYEHFCRSFKTPHLGWDLTLVNRSPHIVLKFTF